MYVDAYVCGMCFVSYIFFFVLSNSKCTTGETHDEKPVRSAFDPSGYDKELVEALERDIVQKKPNVKWSVVAFSMQHWAPSTISLLLVTLYKLCWMNHTGQLIIEIWTTDCDEVHYVSL